MEGFNGTIFAYGQTGSGKTYTITGSPKNYNDRGIIPRSIQYIFEQNETISEKSTIYISYMEIYNEVGYDLLSPKQHKTARCLEELPKVTLLEDKKGEAHIRNLSVIPVTTEQEAMRLLFLGDTNRTIAETPMNEYSSRSHCIFTIYITHRNCTTNRLRSSKLHLVDLAGSERVSKSLTTGIALHEAKHINLSLHFLQQVILALSESKRSHIPYRNSIMTLILKDSLSGNCLTAMLATLALSRKNVQETISTCNFAQRVSLITTEPVINEISDPQQEISFLKKKIEELNEQIASLTSFQNINELSKDHKERCRSEVEQYLQNLDENKELKIAQPGYKQVQFCFNLLKKEIISQKKMYEDIKLKLESSNTEVQNLKEDALKRSKEIDTLKNIIDKIPEQPVSLNSCQKNHPESDKDVNIPRTIYFEGYSNERLGDNNKNLQLFLSNPQNTKTLEYFRKALENKLEMAKLYAETIDQCQKNISYITQKLRHCFSLSEKNNLVSELEGQQNIYRKALIDLEDVQKETIHLESGLKQAEIKTERNFEYWLQKNESNIESNTFVSNNGYRDRSLISCGTNRSSPSNMKASFSQNPNLQCTCSGTKPFDSRILSNYPCIQNTYSKSFMSASGHQTCSLSTEKTQARYISSDQKLCVYRINSTEGSKNTVFGKVPLHSHGNCTNGASSEKQNGSRHTPLNCGSFPEEEESFISQRTFHDEDTYRNNHFLPQALSNCNCVSLGKKNHSILASKDCTINPNEINRHRDYHVMPQASVDCTCNISHENESHHLISTSREHDLNMEDVYTIRGECVVPPQSFRNCKCITSERRDDSIHSSLEYAIHPDDVYQKGDCHALPPGTTECTCIEFEQNSKLLTLAGCPHHLDKGTFGEKQKNRQFEREHNHLQADYIRLTQENTCSEDDINNICINQENINREDSFQYESHQPEIVGSHHSNAIELANVDIIEEPRTTFSNCKCIPNAVEESEVTKDTRYHFSPSNGRFDIIAEDVDNEENEPSSELDQEDNVSTDDSRNEYFEETDSNEFRHFMTTVSLSGDAEVDKEIYSFYRSKFC